MIGRGQPVGAKVLTPTGWATMGGLRLGGQVIGSDGQPHYVSAVWPCGEDDIYWVSFSDGVAAECARDHLWQVASIYDRKRGVSWVLPLREIVDGSGRFGAGTGAGTGGVCYPSGPPKWSVPLVEPVRFAPMGELPIQPYLLGALLGDGSFRGGGTNGSGGVSFAAHADDADEMQRRLTPLLPGDMAVSRRDRGGWTEFYFKSSRYINPLSADVRALGLWGLHGPDKYIPGRYLRAPVINRIALLQGLIDTDGSIGRKQPNLVRFTSTSQQLANQLAEIVGGLGGSVSIARRPGRKARTVKPWQPEGTGKPQWVVIVKRLPVWITPCRLSRKADWYRPPSHRAGRWRYIVNVEPAGRAACQCIRVDARDGLYVTDGYVLTRSTPPTLTEKRQK